MFWFLSPVRLPVPPLQQRFDSFEFTVTSHQAHCSGFCSDSFLLVPGEHSPGGHHCAIFRMPLWRHRPQRIADVSTGLPTGNGTGVEHGRFQRRVPQGLYQRGRLWWMCVVKPWIALVADSGERRLSQACGRLSEKVGSVKIRLPACCYQEGAKPRAPRRDFRAATDDSVALTISIGSNPIAFARFHVCPSLQR